MTINTAIQAAETSLPLDVQINQIFESMDTASSDLKKSASTFSLFFNLKYLIKEGVDVSKINQERLKEVGTNAVQFFRNIETGKLAFSKQKAELRDKLGSTPSLAEYEIIATDVSALNEQFSDWLIDLQNTQIVLMSQAIEIINYGLPEGKKLKQGEEA